MVPITDQDLPLDQGTISQKVYDFIIKILKKDSPNYVMPQIST